MYSICSISTISLFVTSMIMVHDDDVYSSFPFSTTWWLYLCKPLWASTYATLYFRYDMVHVRKSKVLSYCAIQWCNFTMFAPNMYVDCVNLATIMLAYTMYTKKVSTEQDHTVFLPQLRYISDISLQVLIPHTS